MVRSAIQVSGLSELSSLVSSVFALLSLLSCKHGHCQCSCHGSCHQAFYHFLFHVVSSTSLNSQVPFLFLLLPQSDFRDLLTDPVADYYKHQSYQTLDQTDRRRISKLSSLNTDTQNVYIKGISQRHVTRCT